VGHGVQPQEEDLVRRLLVISIVLFVVFGGLAVAPEEADAVVPGDVGRIVFWSDRDTAQGELYSRAFAGGVWQRLTWNTSYERTSAWSPDGSKIAYASDTLGTFDIWVMNPNGGAKLPLTSDGFDNTEPTWAPDGSRIAYTSDQGPGLDWDIWVMSSNGSGKVNLTPSTSGIQDYNPAWSPDGSRIAFVSNRAGTQDIYVMNPDGSNVTNVTNNAAWGDEEPVWSPDGTQIAFLSRREGLSKNVYVMNADGSNQRQITDSSATKIGVAWSPDGAHISFTSWEDGDADLWMVDPDGSNPGHLTDHPGEEWWVAWESVNRPPIASNDGPYQMSNGRTLHGSSVLSNDSDPDGEELVAELATGPTQATSFSLAADGTFNYERGGPIPAIDSFTYRARDTRSGLSNVATVTIMIGFPDSVGLVDPATGMWHLKTIGAGVSDFYYGNPGDYPFMGDWDCNGVDTPGLYRQSDGYVYLRNSNTQGNADLTFFFGNPGDVPLAGDFNGDGCDTVSIYRPSEARFYIINALGQDGGGLGAADYSFLFGDAGDKPVVGDWDGDAIDEIGLHRESSGFFYYRNSLSTGIADGEFYFGDPGDRFVAGDWGTVDGADTPGLFRPSDLTFYLRYTLSQGNADEVFAWPGAGPGWLPVAGNFGVF
jgi:Tol biopolymer transport system component